MGWGDYDSDTDDEEAVLTPGDRFVAHMVGLHLENKVTAEDLCIAMHWAAESGMAEARRWAMPPGNPSTGHYSRKVKAELGYHDDSDLYSFSFCGHTRYSLSRTTIQSWAIPLHEQLVQDFAGDASTRFKLRELLASRALPPAYFDHPIVKGSPDEDICPIGIYIDAVPYSQTDSVLGWWAINLVSGRRFLYALLRKSQACICGCKSWDSFYCFFQLTIWSLQACARGAWPEHRHDGTDFGEYDSGRRERGGQPMQKFACIYMKGDWSEYTNTLGLQPWNSTIRPCFLCNTPGGGDMFIGPGNTGQTCRWRENLVTDYADACARCTHDISIDSPDALRELEDVLHYDKRSDGFSGRVLKKDWGGLRRGDRLEPCSSLPDPGALSGVALPAVVRFWRKSAETLTKRPNPFFGIGAGYLAADLYDSRHFTHGLLRCDEGVRSYCPLVFD